MFVAPVDPCNGWDLDDSETAIQFSDSPAVSDSTASDDAQASVLSEIDAGGFTPVAVSSGHTCIRKVILSNALMSPLCLATAGFLGRDVYVLELGADLTLMGYVGVILALWVPVCFPLTGYMMERRLLSCRAWGRRAPWYVIGMTAASICSCFVWVPPVMDPTGLSVWFLFLGVIMVWGLCVAGTAFQSARIEIYPLAEERSDLESMVKVVGSVGTSVGWITVLIIAAQPTRVVMICAGLFLLCVGLTSNFSVPALCDAKQPVSLRTACARHEFGSLMSNRAFVHLLVYRFVEGFFETTVLTTSLYYLTFVDELQKDERSSTGLIAGLLFGAIAMIMALPWTKFFRERRRVNPNVVAAVILALSLLAPLVLFGLNQTYVRRPVPFLVYTIVLQATFTGQTFWRALALGWVADADTHATKGRRREALFAGVDAGATSIGRAVAVFTVLIGLASTGMEIRFCQLECEDDSDCLSACDLDNLEQPRAVRIYIECLIYLVAPAAQAICVFLVFTFPIYGSLLDTIYEEQAKIYGDPPKDHHETYEQ